MPADVTGTDVVTESEDGRVHFEFRRGPIFGTVILADAINRGPPQTQSALLEAMQERRVTIGRQAHVLDPPFIVLATQNPIEMEGTYPLPEAQLDRFFFKVVVKYSSLEELKQIANRTTGEELPTVSAVMNAQEVVAAQSLVRQVLAAPEVIEYAGRVVLATHPDSEQAVEAARKYVRYGASPRAVQALVLASKVTALVNDRYNISFDDVRHNLLPALRHRIILNFEGEAEGITPDEILRQVVEELAVAAEV
jgi:MoxR-like ATPase